MARSVVYAIKRVMKTVLDHGNWLVIVAVYGSLAVVIIDFLVPADPIPVLPFEGPEVENPPIPQ